MAWDILFAYIPSQITCRPYLIASHDPPSDWKHGPGAPTLVKVMIACGARGEINANIAALKALRHPKPEFFSRL
jgi:hypothetical protein